MNLKHYIICLLLFALYIISSGQNLQNRHLVLLELTNENTKLNKNLSTGILSTEEPALNKVLKKYNAFHFFKCVPDAKKEKFRNLYQIEIEGDINSFIKELEKTGNFKFKKELEYFTVDDCSNPVSYNDPWLVNHWVATYPFELLEAGCAWSLTLGSSSIVVGFADTEFKTHEDLVNQMVYVGGPITDEYPHGLYTTGCCSPETNNNKGIAGIGYNTKMAGYRVSHTIWPNGSVTGSPYSAIISAWDDDRPIINVSWSGTGLSTTEAQQMVNDGIVLVLSGGNTPNSTSHSSIADIPGVIVVSSVNKDNEHGPSGHAHNQWIDLCAPGVNVGTCEDPDSAKLYRSVWGTSAAAPYVSGTIGLMLARNSSLSPPQIERILETTCDPIADAASYPGLLGAGRLNSYCAVYNSVPLTVGGYPTTGTYKRYFVNILQGTVDYNRTVNIVGAEVTMTLPFEVKTGCTFSIEPSNDFSCN